MMSLPHEVACTEAGLRMFQRKMVHVVRVVLPVRASMNRSARKYVNPDWYGHTKRPSRNSGHFLVTSTGAASVGGAAAVNSSAAVEGPAGGATSTPRDGPGVAHGWRAGHPRPTAIKLNRCHN